MISKDSTNKKYCNLHEINISNFMEKTITKIVNLAEQSTQINALLAFGSLAKKSMRHYSNLNFIFISYSSLNNIRKQLDQLLASNLIYTIEKTHKLLYYLNYEFNQNSRILELDIRLVDNKDSLQNIFLGSDLKTTDLENIILVDKKNFIKSFLSNLLKENEYLKANLQPFIKETSSNFVEYYIHGLMNLRKTELYHYYFNMSKAFSELLKLESIYQHNTEDLYHPVFTFSRMDLWKEFKYYQNLIPTISLSKIAFRKEYVKRFLALLKELELEYDIDLNIASKEFLINKLTEECYYWNLRDISYIDSLKLKEKRFYRSSDLTRYNEDQDFTEFLKNKNINTIIDLRSKEEVVKDPYKNIENMVTYINIQIGNKENIDLSKLKYVNFDNKQSIYATFYEVFLRYYQNEIKEVFQIFIDYNPGFVIHCHAGKDRTGIITALLLGLVEEEINLTKPLILEDYLNSGNNTDYEKFKVFEKTIEEFGGYKQYLKSVGLSNADISKIIEKFVI